MLFRPSIPGARRHPPLFTAGLVLATGLFAACGLDKSEAPESGGDSGEAGMSSAGSASAGRTGTGGTTAGRTGTGGTTAGSTSGSGGGGSSGRAAGGAQGEGASSGSHEPGGRGGEAPLAGAGGSESGSPGVAGAGNGGSADEAGGGGGTDSASGAGGEGGAPTPVENCSNGLDDDGDARIDCLDGDCGATLFCGDEPIAARCEEDSDCAGGICIPEDPHGFPGGYCAAPCTLGGDACGSNAVCVPFSVGHHPAVCWKACTVGVDDCGPLYVCEAVTSVPDYGCAPACTRHEDCPELGNCNFERGFCDALIEICGNGEDDDSEGSVDCEDMNCCDSPACAGNPALSCP
ncbi:MAG TPA: hypothetical protein VGK73_14650 [Polyangiaceae bacterium]